MSDFNTVMVNKVINVIRYTLIQYREENNDLIRTVRQIAGENLMYNDLALTYTENNDYLLYNVLEKWVTASGQDLPLNVPDTFTTYYAKRMTVKMPNTIEIIKNQRRAERWEPRSRSRGWSWCQPSGWSRPGWRR